MEGANIKLGAVATDILGKSGRDMLRALVGGATDAGALAELARGRMREKIPQLEQALSGHFAAHQQFLVAQQLAHIEGWEALIERVNHEIAARLEAEAEAIEGLQRSPGSDGASPRSWWPRWARI